MDEKSSSSKSRPLSIASARENSTAELLDIDLAGFLRDEVREMSAAERDEAAMRAMGRRQLLDRNFGLISMIGFTTTMMANWEAEALSISAGLLNGGNVALIYGYILVFFGTLATAYSLAELASMYPTAGGQYHFVALLAPRKIKNILSFLAGYISILAWQATTASCAFIAATVVQGLLILNFDSYEFQKWHGTLMFILIIIVAALFNTSLARSLPFIEGAIILLHICGFFAVLIPLVMFGPQSSAKTVFTTGENRGGWSSDGLSWSIGIISSAYPFLCYDG
jgi:choline transport protein